MKTVKSSFLTLVLISFVAQTVSLPLSSRLAFAGGSMFAGMNENLAEDKVDTLISDYFEKYNKAKAVLNSAERGPRQSKATEYLKTAAQAELTSIAENTAAEIVELWNLIDTNTPFNQVIWVLAMMYYSQPENRDAIFELSSQLSAHTQAERDHYEMDKWYADISIPMFEGFLTGVIAVSAVAMARTIGRRVAKKVVAARVAKSGGGALARRSMWRSFWKSKPVDLVRRYFPSNKVILLTTAGAYTAYGSGKAIHHALRVKKVDPLAIMELVQGMALLELIDRTQTLYEKKVYDQNGEAYVEGVEPLWDEFVEWKEEYEDTQTALRDEGKPFHFLKWSVFSEWENRWKKHIEPFKSVERDLMHFREHGRTFYSGERAFPWTDLIALASHNPQLQEEIPPLKKLLEHARIHPPTVEAWEALHLPRSAHPDEQADEQDSEEECKSPYHGVENQQDLMKIDELVAHIQSRLRSAIGDYILYGDRQGQMGSIDLIRTEHRIENRKAKNQEMEDTGGFQTPTTLDREFYIDKLKSLEDEEVEKEFNAVIAGLKNIPPFPANRVTVLTEEDIAQINQRREIEMRFPEVNAERQLRLHRRIYSH